jgi:hypothetical protein
MVMEPAAFRPLTFSTDSAEPALSSITATLSASECAPTFEIPSTIQ